MALQQESNPVSRRPMSKDCYYWTSRAHRYYCTYSSVSDTGVSLLLSMSICVPIRISDAHWGSYRHSLTAFRQSMRLATCSKVKVLSCLILLLYQISKATWQAVVVLYQNYTHNLTLALKLTSSFTIKITLYYTD